MESTHLPAEPGVQRFWGRYLDVLRLFRVPDKARPWYQRHIQDFIDAHPDTRLRERTPALITAWFERLGRDTALAEWQYLQRIDAIRLLYMQLLKSPWAAGFDWARWLLDGRGLEPGHPTVARTYETALQNPPDPKNTLSRAAPDVYRKFLAVVRIADYSVSTEHSYLAGSATVTVNCSSQACTAPRDHSRWRDPGGSIRGGSEPPAQSLLRNRPTEMPSNTAKSRSV